MQGGEPECSVERTGLGPSVPSRPQETHQPWREGRCPEQTLDRQLRIQRSCPNSATQQLCDQRKPLSLSGLQFIHLEDRSNRGNEIYRVWSPEAGVSTGQTWVLIPQPKDSGGAFPRVLRLFPARMVYVSEGSHLFFPH